MAAIRTLLRKYWILVVIVLWVVAWANRDRLAGDDAVATAVVTESSTQGAETPTPPLSAPISGSDSAQATTHAANEETVSAVPPAPRPDSPAVGIGPEARAAATPSAAQPDASAAQSGSMTGSNPALGRSVQPDPSDAVRRSGVEPAPADGRSARPEAPISKAQGAAEAIPAAELLGQARVAYRSRGPRGAAEILARGLRDIPPDAPERADLLGEMGNFYISAGDFPQALAAYDRALMALPAEARATMITHLAPVYDRYHPMGRSYLEQFR